MKLWALVLLSLTLVGCAHLPKINFGKDTVVGPRDAGKPATLTKGEGKTMLGVPEGTEVVTVESDPTPATEKTPYIPRQVTTSWKFSQPTAFETWRADTHADTGTVDTTIAQHRIDVAESRWLLFTAIACGICGILARSLLPAWPAIPNGLFIAAACAGLSWKLSDIPSYLWAIVLGIVIVLILGYKRAEWDKNHDGIPDILQR